MGFLKGKRILVTGMLSNRSIAYGVARACAREGAELAFTYQGEGIRERVEGPATSRTTPRSRPYSRNWAGNGATWTAWCTPSPSRLARP
jgi:NAD(P)-dependent dehydrogenase (short-subunit alcohol dehydrogenase family)